MTTHTEKTNPFADFLFRNAWALILVVASVVGQWAVFGVRLDNLEDRVSANAEAIEAPQDQANATALDIAQIQKDIEYMRMKLDRIIP